MNVLHVYFTVDYLFMCFVITDIRYSHYCLNVIFLFVIQKLPS